MLSGAKGLTYGSYGIWNWGEPVTWLGNMWDFTTALNQPSADQIQYLFELFSGMEWWKLVPSHQLIQNQSTSWLNKMALSKTTDGQLALAYLPDNPRIDINMSAFPGAMNARWFNPLTNAGQTETASVVNSGIHSFTKPSGWTDAVLVLHNLASTPPAPQRLRIE